MAVHPLRPATYLRLGGPLPHQPANRTQSSPAASLFIRLLMRRPDHIRSYQSFPSVIPVCRASSLRVTHPSALAHLCKHSLAKDLHVLSILSAFILSQDQTLHSTLFFSPYLFFHLFFCFFLFSFHCPRQPVSPIDKNHSIKIHPLCQYLFRLFFNIFFELLSNTYFYWVLSL